MTFEFYAIYGDEERKVKISNPSGNGCSFHIMINDYYNGVIIKQAKDWKAYLNSDEFTSADCDALIEMLALMEVFY